MHALTMREAYCITYVMAERSWKPEKVRQPLRFSTTTTSSSSSPVFTVRPAGPLVFRLDSLLLHSAGIVFLSPDSKLVFRIISFPTEPPSRPFLFVKQCQACEHHLLPLQRPQIPPIATATSTIPLTTPRTRPARVPQWVPSLARVVPAVLQRLRSRRPDRVASLVAAGPPASSLAVVGGQPCSRRPRV